MSLRDELAGEFRKVSKFVVLDDIKETQPSGIKLLDTILGGGFVIGSTTMLIGTPGSGKSSLAAQTAGALLKSVPDSLAIYFDSEQSFNYDRLKQLGTTALDRAMIVSVDISIEKIFEYMEKIFELKEKHDLVDVPFIVIWDSVAATQSERVEDADNPEQITGYNARSLSFNLNKYLKYIKKYKIIFIVVNQLRDKISMGRFSPAPDLRWLGNKDIYGGNTLKFLSFTIINMQPTNPEFHSTSESTGGLVTGFDGTTVRVNTIKNKLCRPNFKIQLAFGYNNGFSDAWSNLLYLRDKKIVTPGSWWKIKGIDKKFRAKEFLDIYNNDESFRLKFDEIMLEELDKLRELLKPSDSRDIKILEPDEVTQQSSEEDTVEQKSDTEE